MSRRPVFQWSVQNDDPSNQATMSPQSSCQCESVTQAPSDSPRCSRCCTPSCGQAMCTVSATTVVRDEEWMEKEVFVARIEADATSFGGSIKVGLGRFLSIGGVANGTDSATRPLS